MKIELSSRSNGACELCESTISLSEYEVTAPQGVSQSKVIVCSVCLEQLENRSEFNASHWQCLSKSMWSSVPAVQVLAWRILSRLSTETWANDLLEMLYLDDELLAWAKNGQAEFGMNNESTKDCNGLVLQGGDSVILTKDLDVKGANFTAKRGTTVKNISLTDNPEHIEGRVNGTRIVILSCFVKRA